MGFFSSLGKTIGAVAGIAAPFIAGMPASAFKFGTPDSWAGVASGLGQMSANNQALDWKERMSNTQYQRQVADMRAAGLNPMSISGNGAGVPNAEVDNPAVSGMAAKASAKQLQIQSELMEEQKKVFSAEAQKLQADTMLIREKTISEPINRMYTQSMADLNYSQKEQVDTYVEKHMPMILKEIESRIANIDSDTERIKVQTQLEQLRMWEIEQMVAVAYINAEANMKHAAAAQTSANAAYKDAQGREDAGYYEAQADAARIGAVSDIGGIITSIVSGPKTRIYKSVKNTIKYLGKD